MTERKAISISIILVLIIIAASVAVYVTHMPQKTISNGSKQIAEHYLILSGDDSGTTTSILFPTQVIIELPNENYKASSTQIIDSGTVFADQRIETYNAKTIVSGSIIKPGSIVITYPQLPNLTYTFSVVATTTPHTNDH